MPVGGLIVRALGGGTTQGTIGLLITRGLGEAAAVAALTRKYFVQIAYNMARVRRRRR